MGYVETVDMTYKLRIDGSYPSAKQFPFNRLMMITCRACYLFHPVESQAENPLERLSLK